MHLRLKIDESSEAPIYRQISEQIAALIKSGSLRRGEHLPPERELALQLKIARGTVKKAYESLVNQRYIVAARGRGSTVALDAADDVSATKSGMSETTSIEAFSDSSLAPLSRAEQADRIITEAIIGLEDLGFNYKQISDLFGLMLARRREQVSRFAIASVDCNPEALGIYQKQLAMLTHMNTARILLADLHAAASADAMLEPFDLILTTSNHVEELRKLAPKMAGKVVPVIVAPTQATLIALARLENGSRAGVLHQSGRFFSIIRGWLQKSGFQGDVKGFNTELETAEELESFVSDRTVLVTPPGFAAQLSGEHLRVINRFRMNGGQLIDFEYQIERGSLLHLEELIRSLINKTRK